MAHRCPSCDCFCTCCGDIDDIDMGEWDGCKHWVECEGEDEDDDDWLDEDFDDEGLTTKTPNKPQP
jgi:hypothetical protein